MTSISWFVLRLLCEGNAVFMVPSLAFCFTRLRLKSAEGKVKVEVRRGRRREVRTEERSEGRGEVRWKLEVINTEVVRQV